MRHHLLAPWLLLLLLGSGLPARAANDGPGAPPDDLDALSLADKASDADARPARAWRLFVEGAVGQGRLRGSDDKVSLYRGSIDFRFDGHLAPGLRAVFSDRLDGIDSDGVPPGDNVNTLREAYLSWARTEDQILDLGRVNIRNGAATGFNPTDWFKANALRAIVDPDPAVLRENRQGTVVLQGQQLWDRASLTVAFSPKLGRSPDPETFALNAGATNPSNRYLVAGSYKVSDQFNPQLLVYGGTDIPVQVGMNLSALVTDAVVLYGEIAAGKGQTLVSQALSLAEPDENQQRASVGLTYTTPFNLTLTGEAEYNSAAPRGDQWDQLPGQAQQQVLASAQSLQDLPTRSQWFLHAVWKDLWVKRFNLSGFLRQDMQSPSRAVWLEGRYAWDRAEMALQWQAFSGSPGTVFYAVPQRQTVQLVLRIYL